MEKPIFIKLSTDKINSIYVNIAHLSNMIPLGEQYDKDRNVSWIHTRINVLNGTSTNVLETPEEIMELIDNAINKINDQKQKP